MGIDQYGDGLTILIHGTPGVSFPWRSFSSWFSARKYLPDASVIVAIPRGDGSQNCTCFWSWRLGVTHFTYRGGVDEARRQAAKRIEHPGFWATMEAGTLILEAVQTEFLTRLKREGDFDSLSRLAKDEEVCPVISIRSGVGSFVLENWIDRSDTPFRRSGLYRQGSLSVNENRVLSLWEQMSQIYEAIG